MENKENSAISKNNKMLGKKTKAVPMPTPEIGIDDEHSVISEILDSSESTILDTQVLNSFLDVATSRDQQYSIIDQMCQDSIPAAALAFYTEDATTTNENKQVVWAVSNNPTIQKTVTFILESLQVDKNIYKWANSIIKYGDVYLKLFRESDYKDDPIFKLNDNDKKQLNEDINIVLHKDEDHLVYYVEMVDNPATMFELTKFGKTAGFIKANVNTKNTITSDPLSLSGMNYTQYTFNKRDVDIYEPNDYVHGSLEDNVDRISEEVKILIDKDNKVDSNEPTSITYKVRSGRSIFYPLFRIWREISLLENSLMLSRITKSSITRVIQVEVGNIAKEETAQVLQSVKQMIEQKAALNPGSNFSEYTNPGPVENNIYMPTHDGKGAITTAQIGGDYDPKQLTDIDYFKNKFYGTLGIPKQYFGDTDDGAGFNGGESLTLISSKYAKKVIKIQTALSEMITTLVNIFLIDRGLTNYINKFTINMLVPMTQEEKDRKDNQANGIGIARDVMSLLDEIQDPIAKLKILKSLLANSVNNPETISLIEEEITKMEKEQAENPDNNIKNPEGTPDFPSDNDLGGTEDIGFDLDSAIGLETEEEIPEEIPEEETDILPTPGETGVDLINNVEED